MAWWLDVIVGGVHLSVCLYARCVGTHGWRVAWDMRGVKVLV